MAAIFDLTQAIAIKFGEFSGGQDGINTPLFGSPVAMDEQGSVTEAVRQRRIVQHHDDASTAIAGGTGE